MRCPKCGGVHAPAEACAEDAVVRQGGLPSVVLMLSVIIAVLLITVLLPSAPGLRRFWIPGIRREILSRPASLPMPGTNAPQIPSVVPEYQAPGTLPGQTGDANADPDTTPEVKIRTTGEVLPPSGMEGDLFTAVKQRNTATVRKLLGLQPNLVKARNMKGATALHLAAILGDRDLADLLIKRGADVNAVCTGNFFAGQTPLHLAADFKQLRVTALLLARQANIDARDAFGETPLHEAAMRGDEKVLSLLLDSRATIDVQQRDGLTPLDMAIVNRQDRAVELLVEHGADVNLAAKDGTTPVSLARMCGYAELVNYLGQHGGK